MSSFLFFVSFIIQKLTKKRKLLITATDEEVSSWQSRKEKCLDRDVISVVRPTGSSPLRRS